MLDVCQHREEKLRVFADLFEPSLQIGRILFTQAAEDSETISGQCGGELSDELLAAVARAVLEMAVQARSGTCRMAHFMQECRVKRLEVGELLPAGQDDAVLRRDVEGRIPREEADRADPGLRVEHVLENRMCGTLRHLEALLPQELLPAFGIALGKVRLVEVQHQIVAQGELLLVPGLLSSREVPEMLVGAGTVLTHDQLDRALDAGARFIVSPGFNPDTVRYGLSKGALMIPGTATPGEMEQAMALGLEVVKFFPAEQNGGVAKLKALAGPYKTLKWMPTGGVNAKNLADYLAFDQIVACGGTWMVKKDLIQQENWAEITRLSREAVRTMLGFSLDHVGVNCGSEAEADRLARTLCDMFGFAYQMGNSSVQALHAVECTKTPGRGTHGHIAIATSNVDRAVYHLGLCGIRCLPETRKTDAKGNTKAIYIDGEFGGFAIHLVRR